MKSCDLKKSLYIGRKFWAKMKTTIGKHHKGWHCRAGPCDGFHKLLDYIWRKDTVCICECRQSIPTNLSFISLDFYNRSNQWESMVFLQGENLSFSITLFYCERCFIWFCIATCLLNWFICLLGINLPQSVLVGTVLES